MATPPTYDLNSVRAGLLLAMSFGTPNRSEDQATFYVPVEDSPGEDSPGDDPIVDGQGIPFNPDAVAPDFPLLYQPVVVPCAVEMLGTNTDEDTHLGDIAPVGLRLTLLEAEYDQIRGFSFMTYYGVRYDYERTHGIGFGPQDVYQVLVKAVDVA
jgi:hypothetical protein